MKKILLSLSLFLFFNALAFAGNLQNDGPYNNKTSTVLGTLSISVNTSPAVGLPDPQIIVMRGFLFVAQNTVPWGTTWNLPVTSGNYRIHPLPVTDGTNFYVANTVFVFVPDGVTVNRLITYTLL
jgi:hypothetical protein